MSANEFLIQLERINEITDRINKDRLKPNGRLRYQIQVRLYGHSTKIYLIEYVDTPEGTKEIDVYGRYMTEKNIGEFWRDVEGGMIETIRQREKEMVCPTNLS